MRECDACGVTEGGELLNETLSEFREHLLCSWCQEKWVKNEKILGEEIPLTKFQFARYSNEEKFKLENFRERKAE